MSHRIDTEMTRVAQLLWPEPQQVEAVAGGMFNRVLKVESAAGTHYLKRFTESASSGDFPPLPTRAAQRCLVACSWHDLAQRACSGVGRMALTGSAARDPAVPQRPLPQVQVPALLAIQSELDLVAMEAVPGAPLQQQLLQADDDAAAARATLKSLVRWLAVLHTLPLEPRGPLLAASRPFKAYKVDLQYARLITELPPRVHAGALQFIRDYLADESDPVHGDLNSRNVLVDDNSLSVIDFEQGHFGAGIYDLAYLVSEYAIQALNARNDPRSVAALAWDHYGSARRLADPMAQLRRFQVHLGFQVLYRLVGPSRAAWTGHLDDTTAQRVRHWSLTTLEALL